MFSPYLVKWNISQFVHISSNVRFKTKSHDSYAETDHSKCSVFGFGFETCIKTILPLISRLISEALLVAERVSITCCFSSLTSLTGFWYVLLHVARFQSVSPGAGALVWFHAAKGDSEWCVGPLLWCLAAQTVAARHLSSCWRLLLSSASPVHKSTELLWHKTPDFTPDVASQQTRPQFCRLQITDSHSGMRLSETARDAKHRWWAVVINRMILY